MNSPELCRCCGEEVIAGYCGCGLNGLYPSVIRILTAREETLPNKCPRCDQYIINGSCRSLKCTGLYRKFTVRRIDGSDAPGEKQADLPELQISASVEAAEEALAQLGKALEAADSLPEVAMAKALPMWPVYAVGLAVLCLLCYGVGRATAHQIRPITGIYLHENSKTELVDVFEFDAAGNEIAHWYAFPGDRIDNTMTPPDERWKGSAE